MSAPLALAGSNGPVNPRVMAIEPARTIGIVLKIPFAARLRCLGAAWRAPCDESSVMAIPVLLPAPRWCRRPP